MTAAVVLAGVVAAFVAMLVVGYLGLGFLERRAEIRDEAPLRVDEVPDTPPQAKEAPA